MTTEIAEKPKTREKDPEVVRLEKKYGKHWYRPARRETVYDYQGKSTWAASLPLTEILAHLDPSARVVPERRIFQWIGLALGAFLIYGSATTYLYTILPLIVADLILAFPTLGIGAGLGFFIGRFFNPQPYWIVQRAVVETGEGKEAKEEVIAEPVPYRGMALEWLPDGKIAAAKKAMDDQRKNGHQPLPLNRRAQADVEDAMRSADAKLAAQTCRATFLYELVEMRDEREFLRGGHNTMQKLQLAGIMITAVSMVALVVLLGVAVTSEPKSSTPQQTTQQQPRR